MDVHPQNVAERCFAIMVLIAGLVLFSSFISSITGSMSQLRNMQADRSKQFWLLRRYLKQQKVPMDLCFRVLRYTEYVRSPACMSAQTLSSMDLAAGDPLFSLVDASKHMFFIETGAIRYTVHERDTSKIRRTVADPQADADADYLCEVALWSPFQHVGVAQAMAEASVIRIEVFTFCELVHKDPELRELLSLYAHRFVEHMNAQSIEWVEVSIQAAGQEHTLDFQDSWDNWTAIHRRSEDEKTGKTSDLLVKSASATGLVQETSRICIVGSLDILGMVRLLANILGVSYALTVEKDGAPSELPAAMMLPPRGGVFCRGNGCPYSEVGVVGGQQIMGHTQTEQGVEEQAKAALAIGMD
eukprot:s239_g4.t1